MVKFANFLQTNPYIIIILFVAAIIGLVTSWKPFYALLRGKTTLPKWIIVLFIILGFVSLFYNIQGKSELHDIAEYEIVRGKEFGIEPVEMSGKNFMYCKFRGSQLVFNGRSGFAMSNCELEGIHITLVGPARTTLEIFSTLYQEEPLRPKMEATFESIRKGKTKVMMLPEYITE